MGVERALTLALQAAQPPTALSWLAIAVVIVLVVLLIVGLVVITRRRRAWSVADDGVTELADSGGQSAAAAHLIATEDFGRLPLKIDLFFERTVSVGRNSRECNVLLDDIGISRRHASVRYRNGHFYLRDDGSKGGTFLHRARPSHFARDDADLHSKPRLKKSEERMLREGDLVQFYTFSYRFHLADESTEIPDDEHTQWLTMH